MLLLRPVASPNPRRRKLFPYPSTILLGQPRPELAHLLQPACHLVINDRYVERPTLAGVPVTGVFRQIDVECVRVAQIDVCDLLTGLHKPRSGRGPRSDMVEPGAGMNVNSWVKIPLGTRSSRGKILLFMGWNMAKAGLYVKKGVIQHVV